MNQSKESSSFSGMPLGRSRADNLSTVTGQDINQTRKDACLCKDMLPHAADPKRQEGGRANIMHVHDVYVPMSMWMNRESACH